MKHTPGLIAGAALAGCLLIIGAGAWLWLQWLALDAAIPWLTMSLRIALFVIPPAYALTFVWQRWGRTRFIEAHHTTHQMRARFQHAQPAHIIEGELVTAPALQAPADVIKPMSEWMAWVDDQPHTLLGGKTRAGKTWLATALLERRIDAGADVFIIDPHSSDWMGLPTAGGGGIDERTRALKAVFDEYNRRMGLREEHKRKTGRELPHDYFDPLVVLIDEANAMLEEQGEKWRGTLKQVASGSRKVSIGLLMLAQSPLVEDLGISGAMRENFSRIALDPRSIQALIDSERDKPRKLALQAEFSTMDRPAAAIIGTQVYLLDRRGLQPGQASASARIWTGWDFARGCAVSSVSPATTVAPQAQIDDDVAEAVISPGAGVAPVATVALSAQEIANIAGLLMTLPTSEVVKKVDGYNGRNYKDIKVKVDAVKSLIEGGAR